MSKCSIYLISKIAAVALTTGIVTAQIDLKTANFEPKMEGIDESDKFVSAGLAEYYNLCKKTFNNSKTDLMLTFLLNGSIFDENDHDAKCFFRCILEMVGATDSGDGPYDAKQASILFTPPSKKEIEGVRLTCAECIKKQAKEDLCDEAYHFMQCVLKDLVRQHGPVQWVKENTPKGIRPEDLPVINK